ncbi:MAG: HU family DNA-binding protein [Candidatus Babeliales bacterium]|nr:HU family DNA-binding protein [Candidatus Babeliales bacterium]
MSGGSMNKTEIINCLSEETTFSKKDITRVLESFTRVIERALKKGEKVSITGFGTFMISKRAARKGINPATKQRINIPAMSVPKFKPGKSLRELVRSV